MTPVWALRARYIPRPGSPACRRSSGLAPKAPPRSLMTIGAAILAVLGMGRLGGRLGLRGPGRYLSGLVLIAGPGTAVAIGAGSWLALGAASLVPWAVRSVFVHSSDPAKGRLTRLAWVVLWSSLLAAMSPVLVVVPPVTALLARALGDVRSRVWLSFAGLIALIIAVPFVMGDPGWLLDVDRRLGLGVAELWPVLLTVAVLPVLFGEDGIGRLGLVGAILSLSALLLVRVPLGGPGIEEALLITASFGSALVVAVALDEWSLEPRRVLAAVAAAAILLLSVGSLAGGRLGLPPGNLNDQFAFAETLAGEGGPGRILLMSVDRTTVPGEARPGPGLWYRVIDGSGMTQDEVWLPDPLPGDDKLEAAIAQMASGSDLRPGATLTEFSIDWVVIDGPESYLDGVLATQLDLVPTPLDPEARVYENPISLPMASGAGSIWERDGAGFVGEPLADRVRISVNADSGWSPEPEASDWTVSVAGEEGAARYRADPVALALSIAAAGLLVVALAVIVVARMRR